MSSRVFLVVFAVLLVAITAVFLGLEQSSAPPASSPYASDAKPTLRCPEASSSSRDMEDVTGDVVDVTADSSTWTARPTHPPVLANRTEARFTREAWDQCVSGVVIVAVLVNVDGSVKNLRVLRGLPLGLDAAAADAIKTWQFIPAVTGGRAVPAVTTAAIWFNPNSRSQQPLPEE